MKYIYTHGHSLWKSSWLLVMLIFLTIMAQAAVETKNLLRNGDFEEAGTPLPGWRINTSPGENYEFTSNAFTGKNALKISLPVAGDATVTSDTSAVTAGEDYLLTFWYRADGMSTKGPFAYDGCYANCYLVWQDVNGKDLGNSLIALPYGPVIDYRAATFTVAAPEGAAIAWLRYIIHIGQEYKGPATALFIDQVRLMKLSKVSMPADAQKWQYLNRTLNAGEKIVDDKDTASGQAIVAESGTTNKNTYLAYGPYTKDQPVGEYVALFRLKVKDNTKKEPVAVLDISGLGNLNGGLAGPKTVYANDFKQPGVYQDIAIRFVRPEESVLEFRVCYQGATDLSYDKVTVIQLGTFKTEKEQAAIWLGE